MIANLVKDYTQLIKDRLVPECRDTGELAPSDWQPPAADPSRQRSILQRPAPPPAAHLEGLR